METAQAQTRPKLPAYLPTSTRAEFRCPQCGHHAPVLFTDPAAFADAEPLPGRDQWAKEAALATAQARLDKGARKALQLLRCPSCGARDPLGQRQGLLRACLPLVGVVPMGFMLTIIGAAMLSPPPLPPAQPPILGKVLAAFLVTALLSILVVLRGRQRLLKEAEAAVKFLSPQEAGADKDADARQPSSATTAGPA